MKRKRILYAILALEIFTLLSIGPFVYNAFFDNPAGFEHKTLEKFERIYEEADYFVALKVKVVLNNGETATSILCGSLIKIDGEIYIITVAHIQDPDEKILNIRVIFQDSYERQPAELVGYHRDLDVALLKFSDPNFIYNGPAAKLGDSDKLKDDDKIMILGVSDYFPEKSTGLVVHYWWFMLFDDDLICSAMALRGYSGGPILNTEGEIIAITKKIFINTGGKTGYTMGTKINAVKKILAELKSGKRIE